MKLKKILDNLDGLDAALQALYVKGDDNKFHLQLEDDDAEPLRRAKEHEVGLRKIAEQERDTLKEQLATANQKVTELTNAQSTGVQELREQLTRDHERQVGELTTKHKKEVEGLNSAIKKTYVDSVATGIAKEIAVDDGAAELLGELLKRRLSVEIVAGEPLTRVLAPDGTASTMTPDQLKNEYFTNEKYASIMRASDASGGGASGGKKGSGASKPFAEMGDVERATLLKQNPAEFHRLVAEERAGQSA